MKRKALLMISAVLILCFSLVLAVSAQETNDNVVDVIAKDSRLDTLHAALVAAGLADSLASADSTFTIFAPRDGAFTALEDTHPGITADWLAGSQDDLASLVSYHVVPGRITSEQLATADTLTTDQGEELTITRQGDNVFVNGSRIVAVDIPAKNGVVHIISDVLLPSTVVLPEPVATESVAVVETTPPATTEPTTTTSVAGAIEAELAAGDDTAELKSIAEVAAEAGSFSKLLDALEATDLSETFAKPGNFTLFAPTDAAFDALSGLNLTESQLKAILLHHVVNDALSRDQLATDDILPTLDGRPLFVNRDGGNILDISGAKVLVFDIPASNGVIHVIDRVLIP